MMIKKALCALSIAFAVGTASAEAPEDVLQSLIDKSDSSYLTQSEQNLMMMPESPAYWMAEDGEALFKEARGPNNVSLEGCDFGKGPGVLKGAHVELPRYFEDAGKVMDLDTRLVYCMKTLQGFTDEDDAVKKKHGNNDIMKLQAYIASQSNGMPWNAPMDHPMEKAMRDAGEVMFYRRSGISDFSCATCHTNESGSRIRASVLPNIAKPEEWTKAVSWPAFRVGHDNLRSTQHRLAECVWQMRQAPIKWGSDASIAMISYWTDLAKGQPAILPDMKR